MRILLIYAGGTIGQIRTPGENYTRPPETSEEFSQAIERILAHFSGHDIGFEFYSSKESSNMQPEDWQKLADLVYQRQGDFDGIIIAHGTDTMAYSANAVALGLYNMTLRESELLVPVIFTGSQLELFQPNSDGDDNLANAVIAIELMAQRSVADVMIMFGRELMLATTALKVSETDLDAFASPGVAAIAKATSQGIRIYNPIVARIPEPKNRLILKQLYCSGGRTKAPSAHFVLNRPCEDGAGSGAAHTSSIIFLSFQPGMHPTIMRKAIDDPNTLAVVIRSLGAGNIATQGRNLIECIRYAVEEYNLPILIASSFPGGNTFFNKDESGNLAIRSGAVQVGSHTEASIVVKLHWLLANGYVSDLPTLIKHMQSSFVGELDGIHSMIPEAPRILPIHEVTPRNSELSFSKRLQGLPSRAP